VEEYIDLGENRDLSDRSRPTRAATPTRTAAPLLRAQTEISDEHSLEIQKEKRNRKKKADSGAHFDVEASGIS